MRKRTAFTLAALLLLGAGGLLALSSTSRVAAAPAKTHRDRAAPTPSAIGVVRLASVRERSAQPARAPATFFAAWGGSARELGRSRPAEGNPVGPMSFAADRRGGTLVLDGVNGRIVRRDGHGEVTANRNIDLRSPEDLAVGPDGSTAVLDRHGDKAVAVYDPNGKSRGKLPLAGEGVSDTGSVTGVFIDGEDVYVEREHASLVKIGSVHGAAAEPRSEIPGRPSRDGASYLNAGLIEPSAGRVWVSSIARATGEHRFTRELRLDAPAESIVLLDTDRTGEIYFAATVSRGDGDDVTLLACLDPTTGAPRGSALLPVNTLPEESFRDLVVLDEGGVLFSLRSESGVSFTRYFCE